MTEKILITSALLYANGPLHFGHIAGAYLPGDVYARFQRLKKNDVLYISGSDEYGVAITMSAEIAGRTPREHVDHFHKVNADLFQKLNFSFDHYSRTTCEHHIEPAQQYFSDLLEKGFIEPRVTEQLYSEEEGRFLADRYVTGGCPKCGYANARGDECPECGAAFEATDLVNPRSKRTGSALIRKKTKHWFLLLDQFKEKLIAWLEQKDWKPNVVNFVKGYINDLRPRAITRDSTWGVPIPLPDTEGKVLYVWFDAPIGYISATMDWAEEHGAPDRWKDYWLDPKTKLVNFIGKDNIPFHAAIFPAMTMGQSHPYKLVDELPANEFYKLEGRQFSKSDGWFIDLEEFFKNYTSDQIRYMIAATAPETSDSEFTWKDFQMYCNGDLLGKYGNLVNRVMVFTQKNADGVIPEKKDLEDVDREFLERIRKQAEAVGEAYCAFKVRRATQLIMELAQMGNVYFDGKQPWKDAKDQEKAQRFKNTLACCFDCIRLLALVSCPIIPETASKVWKMMGNPGSLLEQSWEGVLGTAVSAGQKIGQPEILFKKIENEQVEKEVEKLHAFSKAKMGEASKGDAKKGESTKGEDLGGNQGSEESFAPLKEKIDFEDFAKLDLRVGVIRQAERVPKSKKLLKLVVDLGFEQRQVVSGISQSYAPEELINQKIVLVANLKPAKLMGIESQGMILAGSNGMALEVVSVKDLPAGSEVS